MIQAYMRGGGAFFLPRRDFEPSFFAGGVFFTLVSLLLFFCFLLLYIFCVYCVAYLVRG